MIEYVLTDPNELVDDLMIDQDESGPDSQVRNKAVIDRANHEGEMVEYNSHIENNRWESDKGNSECLFCLKAKKNAECPLI